MITMLVHNPFNFFSGVFHAPTSMFHCRTTAFFIEALFYFPPYKRSSFGPEELKFALIREQNAGPLP